jgi:hypothetical protein
MADSEPPLPLTRIEHAPYEVRRRWLLAERRNTRIAIAVIVTVVGLAGWGAWRIAQWLARHFT